MKYMGSKNRIAKYILPIMLAEREPDQWWVEPFVGGGNIIDKVDGKRLGADINEYLIAELILIRDFHEKIPDIITEDDYKRVMSEPKVDGLTGFMGFAMSFGGKWFGGYRRDVAGTKGCVENMKTQTRRSKQAAIQQSRRLQGVRLINRGYSDLEIPEGSLIYCDPPYAGTTKYKDAFDHCSFWQWCREKSNAGHTVFVSEYAAPKDFEYVWEKEIAVGLAKEAQNKKGVERLFRYSG